MQFASRAKLGTPLSASASEVAPGTFDRRRPERRNLRARSGNEQPSLALEGHRKWLRLDLNHAIAPPHFQWRAWLERRFTADLARDHQAAGRIHGSYHGRDYAIRRWHTPVETSRADGLERIIMPGLTNDLML
jgi:hypothetical protein